MLVDRKVDRCSIEDGTGYYIMHTSNPALYYSIGVSWPTTVSFGDLARACAEENFKLMCSLIR